MGLPPVALLPNLPNPTPAPTATATAAAPSATSSVLNTLFALPSRNPADASGFSLQSVVVIILGLLLIAAGIFSFKPVQEATGYIAAPELEAGLQAASAVKGKKKK
jgi:hypothetical protein